MIFVLDLVRTAGYVWFLFLTWVGFESDPKPRELVAIVLLAVLCVIGFVQAARDLIKDVKEML